jgi:hypothetical protein
MGCKKLTAAVVDETFHGAMLQPHDRPTLLGIFTTGQEERQQERGACCLS